MVKMEHDGIYDYDEFGGEMAAKIAAPEVVATLVNVLGHFIQWYGMKKLEDAGTGWNNLNSQAHGAIKVGLFQVANNLYELSKKAETPLFRKKIKELADTVVYITYLLDFDQDGDIDLIDATSIPIFLAKEGFKQALGFVKGLWDDRVTVEQAISIFPLIEKRLGEMIQHDK